MINHHQYTHTDRLKLLRLTNHKTKYGLTYICQHIEICTALRASGSTTPAKSHAWLRDRRDSSYDFDVAMKMHRAGADTRLPVQRDVHGPPAALLARACLFYACSGRCVALAGCGALVLRSASALLLNETAALRIAMAFSRSLQPLLSRHLH
ncbi:MAG: hypothetical protein ACLTMG_07015 [Oscillospiraceae bacterium]